MGSQHPSAILFISRDTCSESIAIFFVFFCFYGYRTVIARYVARWGIAQMCLCQIKYQGRVSHHFGGALTSLKSIAREREIYRYIYIYIYRDPFLCVLMYTMTNNTELANHAKLAVS